MFMDVAHNADLVGGLGPTHSISPRCEASIGCICGSSGLGLGNWKPPNSRWPHKLPHLWKPIFPHPGRSATSHRRAGARWQPEIWQDVTFPFLNDEGEAGE